MQQNIRPEIKKDIDKFGFCILNQTHDEYNAEKGFIRSSEIKNILIDVPAMVKYSLDNPSEKDSRDLVIGSAFDSLVFGREEFEDRFVCFEDKLKPFPNSDYRNKENVSARDKFIASNLPKITLYEKEVDTIEAMYSALKGNESARKIIDNCLPHCNIYWFDAELGCYFKCEIDGVHKTKPTFAELKSTLNASINGFRKAVIDYKYHVQVALYRRGLNAARKHFKHFKQEPINCFLIAQEKSPPYLSSVNFVTEQTFIVGDIELRNGVARLKDCIENNLWGGYEIYSDNPEGILELNLPEWYINRIQEEPQFDFNR